MNIEDITEDEYRHEVLSSITKIRTECQRLQALDMVASAELISFNCHIINELYMNSAFIDPEKIATLGKELKAMYDIFSDSIIHDLLEDE